MGVELFFELGRAIHGLYPAIYHDADAVAVLGFVTIGGGYKYGDGLSRGFVYHTLELTAGYGINPSGRLVQEDNFGAVKNGYREGQFLLPAQRQ